MNELIKRLRLVSLGGWVLIALVLALAAGAAADVKSNEVRSALLQLRPRLDPTAQAVLERGDQTPQAFNVTKNAAEAEALRMEIIRAGMLDNSRAFHARDFVFMGAYGALLLLGGAWAWKRAGELINMESGTVRTFCARILRWASYVAFPAAVIAVGADVAEDLSCLRILDGSINEIVVSAARHACWWKISGFCVSACGGLLNGVAASIMTPEVRAELRAIWDMVVRAHRFAMRGRFSVLAGAVFTTLLLTGPGEDIVRTIATGAFSGEVPENQLPEPDFARIGWFGLTVLLLATTCWGWARLVLAVHFATPGESLTQMEPERQKIENRVRRDLPIYYGAVPFVAAASAFAIAPLREGKSSTFPTTQFFAGSLAPLLLFIILPLFLVIFRANTNASRKAFGPLSWTLSAYCVLAAVHAAVNWKDLHLLGLVPLILLGTALMTFGLGKPAGYYFLPAALLLGALFHGRVGTAVAPGLVLITIGALVNWLSKRADAVDELHIPTSFNRGNLLRVMFSAEARTKMRLQIETDQTAIAEMRQSPAIASASPTEFASAITKLARQNVESLGELLRFCGLLTLMQIVIFVIVLIWPERFPATLGSGAILALGLAGWATAGSALIFLTQAARFPILGSAIVLALLCSGAMDNHKIRIAGPASPAFAEARNHNASGQAPKNDPGPIGEAFDRWHSLAAASGGEPPCIIVAAEGGGIRAAFWPAIVLGTLQDASLERQKEPHGDFASHVFAISGVSGGSFGATVFTALCAEQRRSGKIRELAANLCGNDHLAPTLGALLYPDFVQRFLPFAVLPDRAAAFESSWESSWPQKAGANRMAQPFSELWTNTDSAWLPALFLNTTMVDTGKRAICSNLPIRSGSGGQFIDAHDLHTHLRDGNLWQDIPLSTAAHASARFPLVSPPGRLPSGARIVDGGYFENSGAATGIDLLNAVTKRLDQTKGATKVIFIFLRYADSAGLTDSIDAPEDGASPAIPDDDAAVYLKTTPLNESDGIFGTLLATRSARGSYSQDAVFHRFLARQNVVVLSFTFRGDKIPLSWSLSQRSCNDMLRQLPAGLKLGPTEDERTRKVIESNVAVANRLFLELYGR